MKNRLEIEAALLTAEAALCDAVIKAVEAHGNPEQASANVDKARTICLKLRTKLNQLKRAELIGEATGIEGEGVSAESAGVVNEQDDGTGTATTSLRDYADCAEKSAAHNDPEHSLSRKDVSHGRLKLDLVPASEYVRHQVKRQSIGMLVLLMAFLQYLYLDVQLKIMCLRSPFDGTSIAHRTGATAPNFTILKS